MKTDQDLIDEMRRELRMARGNIGIESRTPMWDRQAALHHIRNAEFALTELEARLQARAKAQEATT